MIRFREFSLNDEQQEDPSGPLLVRYDQWGIVLMILVHISILDFWDDKTTLIRENRSSLFTTISDLCLIKADKWRAQELTDEELLEERYANMRGE